MPSKVVLPRVWNRAELGDHRRLAIEGFVRQFQKEGNVAYRHQFSLAEPTVERLFDETDQLLKFGPSSVSKSDKPRREAARYLAGPPLSDDDLKTIAGVAKLWDAAKLKELSDVIIGARDPFRFPWLFTKPPRKPTADERKTAILWTVGLIAAQKASTERRNESSKRQELTVETVLVNAPLGFVKVKPRVINSVRDLDPGKFCRQSAVGGTRADLSIGLVDGRLLVLECKVSNSEVNSYKRLNHEVGDKASVWRAHLGTQAVSGAVLSGAFSVDNLDSAQSAGVHLFWEHDLTSLVSFVQAAK